MLLLRIRRNWHREMIDLNKYSGVLQPDPLSLIQQAKSSNPACSCSWVNEQLISTGLLNNQGLKGDVLTESDLLPTHQKTYSCTSKPSTCSSLIRAKGRLGFWFPPKYTWDSFKTVVVLKLTNQKRREKPSLVTVMILLSFLRVGHCWPLPVPDWPWVYTRIFL